MSALIEFDEVCKYYQMGDTTVKAADHISMKIEKGEFVAIVGQSGSGKSTCMNIIGCLDVPTQGTYLLNGRDVGKMNRNELAAIRNEMLGFIFQQYNLLPKLNLMENVEVPLVYAGVSRAERHKRAKEVLEKAFGQQRARSMMDRVSKALHTKSFSFIRKVDYKSLMAVIQNEHPQTLAFILSYANAEQASKIIAELPGDIRIDVVERIAGMERAYPPIVKVVEEVVRGKIGVSASEDAMEIGGLNYVADVMNHVDRSTEKDIFDELNIKNPRLAEGVRKLMFVFEDIAYLDPMSIQRFIRDTDSRDLAVALKVANRDVTNAIFSNMSTRMRESIQTDMKFLHNLRMSSVEEAQQRIVSTIRRLEEEGEIVISKDGKDEVIV